MSKTTKPVLGGLLAAVAALLSSAAVAQTTPWYPLPFDGKTVAGEEGRGYREPPLLAA